MNYITMTQARQQLNLRNDTVDEDIIQNWINWSCELIDYWKDRKFDVRIRTIRLDTPRFTSNMIGSFAQLEAIVPPTERVYLDVSDYDLLEVIELLNGDSEEIETGQYITEPANEEYINRIVLRKNSSVKWLPNDDGEYEQAIELTGIFGFNSNYSKCFVDTNVTLTQELSIDGLVIEGLTADVLGKAKDGLQPAIQVGVMLKIDDEFLYVHEIEEDDYAYNVHVEREYNGSTKTIHTNGSKIYVYRPDAQIAQMALRLVQWRYRQKDNDNFDRTFNFATQTATTPSAIPADVRMILGKRKARIYG